MRQCRSDCLFPILRTAWAACRAECKQTLSTCRRLSLSRTAPEPRRSYQRERERERELLFKRETEHLCLRQSRTAPEPRRSYQQ